MLSQKYTEDKVIKTLETPKTIYEIQHSLGCSYRTAWNVVMKLSDDGIVKRRNRCSPQKPIWEYFIEDDLYSSIVDNKQRPKQKFSDLPRKLNI